jgi:peptidoglycan/LPS O-acetylase OafA/YrhL
MFVALNPNANIILEFVLGAIGFLIYKSDFLKKYSQIVIFVSSIIFMLSNVMLDKNFAEAHRVIVFGIPSMLLVAFFARINLPKYSLQNSGNYSYSLYLIHFPLLSIYFKVASYFVPGSTPAWMIILLGVSFCNIAALFAWKYLELPVTSYLRDRFIK